MVLPGRAWCAVAVLGLALAGSACIGAAAPRVQARPAPAVQVEPPAAAAFVAAHQRGDPDAAAQATSPLYRAEAARRGRVGLLDPLWAEAARLVAFSYVGGHLDQHGFAHLLYTSRPLRPGADGPTTVWRLDLDPLGRVIWGEAVRLLPGADVRPIAAADAGALGGSPLPVPGRWAGLAAGEVVGARAPDGSGYYAVGLHREPDETRPAAVLFVIADAAGELSRDAWSFGQPVPLGDAAGGRSLARPFGLQEPGLAPDVRALLDVYLRAVT